MALLLFFYPRWIRYTLFKLPPSLTTTTCAYCKSDCVDEWFFPCISLSLPLHCINNKRSGVSSKAHSLSNHSFFAKCYLPANTYFFHITLFRIQETRLSQSQENLSTKPAPCASLTDVHCKLLLLLKIWLWYLLTDYAYSSFA